MKVELVMSCSRCKFMYALIHFTSFSLQFIDMNLFCANRSVWYSILNDNRFINVANFSLSTHQNLYYICIIS